MKRTLYRARLLNRDGVLVTTATAYAWNSACDKGLSLARDYARDIYATKATIVSRETSGKPGEPGSIGRVELLYNNGIPASLQIGRACDFITDPNYVPLA